jgi:hypothetical protein
MDQTNAANWQAGKYSAGNTRGKPTVPGVASGHKITDTNVPTNEGDLGKPIVVNQTPALSIFQTTCISANVDYLEGGIGTHQGQLCICMFNTNVPS